MVKLLHRLLPTAAQANKFDGGNRRCALCGSLDKDHFHIIRCQHSTRGEWRTQLLARLRDSFIHSNTSPMLCELMLDGLRQWFDSSDNDITLCPDDYHPTMQQILQQNQIGWAQVLLRRFSAAWEYQQRRYQLTQRGEDDDGSQTSAWQANVILMLWEQWYELWKQRNREVHGHELSEIYRHRTLY